MTLLVEAGETQNPSGIQVIYDESVLRENVPYHVSVDQPRATQFLLTHGVPQEKVGQVKLLVKERPSEEFLAPTEGWFKSENLTLALYPDVILEHTKRKPGNRPNHVFLHEAKHLINYLIRPAYEESTSRLFRRVGTATFYVGLLSLMMVVGSALPDMFGPKNDMRDLRLAEITSRMVFGFSIYGLTLISFYQLNPVELSAQRFAYRLNRQQEWQSIVTISPLLLQRA